MYLNENLFLEFLSDREITWAGIDFSLAKFTKDGFDFSNEVIHRYFNEWNLLIISDQKKYDIRMAFRKPVMHYNLSCVTKKNKTVEASSSLVDNIKLENQYTESSIIQYAEKQEFPPQANFSLTFVVESFDQNSKTASVWVILSQASSREVVLCEKFLETPNGFGTRNYWARTFYNILFDIKKKSFLRWVNLVKPDNLIK